MNERSTRRSRMTSDQTPETPEARIARFENWLRALHSAQFAIRDALSRESDLDARIDLLQRRARIADRSRIVMRARSEATR